MSDVPVKEIIKRTLGVFEEFAEDDRNQNLNVVAAMMGGIFAVLGQTANPADCVEIVNGCMKKSGWIK